MRAGACATLSLIWSDILFGECIGIWVWICDMRKRELDCADWNCSLRGDEGVCVSSHFAVLFFIFFIFFFFFFPSFLHFLRFAFYLVLCCFFLPGVSFSSFLLLWTSDSRYLLYTTTAIVYPFTMRGEYHNESSQPPLLFVRMFRPGRRCLLLVLRLAGSVYRIMVYT